MTQAETPTPGNMRFEEEKNAWTTAH